MSAPVNYHRMSLAQKQAHTRECMREAAVVCPVCETQTTAVDLLEHIETRCPGPREPNPCSWMNQVEQWFSILQRKRFGAPNFADLADLEAKVLAFIEEWNETALPFKWTTASFDKMLDRANSWRPRERHWTDDLKAAA